MTGDDGDWDNHEWCDILMGVIDMLGDTNGPGRGEVVVGVTGLGSGDFENPVEFGSNLRSLN